MNQSDALMFGALIGAVSGLLTALFVALIHANVAKKNRENDLRQTAVEARLKAHQEAHKLLLELRASIGSKEAIEKASYKCQEWWFNNCLYLDPSCRKNVYEAALLAHLTQHLDLSETPKIMEKIAATISFVEDAVTLPSLSGRPHVAQKGP